MATSNTHASTLIPKGYAKAEGVSDAVRVLQSRLKDDSKEEYADMLTEKRIRDTIPVAIKLYEADLDDAEKRIPGSKQYFMTVVKPALVKIAKSGKWQSNYSFETSYGLTDGCIFYDGLLVRLFVETPDAQFKGFALPIMDVLFGRVGT